MLVLAFLIMMFLPNSVEYGYKVNLLGTTVPAVYLLITAILFCSVSRIFEGLKQLPQVGFFLVFALIHTVVTYPNLTINTSLGLIKSYCPMLMILYVIGSWKSDFSFERFKKLAMICICLIIPYYLAYAVSSTLNSSGWGSGIIRSGISGLPRVLLPIGGPNVVGVILVLIFPLYLYDFTDTDGNKIKKLGRLSIISGLIGLTFSRGSYLVAGIQSVIHARYSKKKVLLGSMMGIVFLMVIVTGLSTSRVFWAEKISWKKIETGSTSLTLRAVTYDAMFKRIQVDPLGSGIGKHFVNDPSINSLHHQSGMVKLIKFDGRQIMYQSHSTWLLILVELGWIGGALFCWIFIEIIRRLYLAVKTAKHLNHMDNIGQFRTLIISVVSFLPWLAISDSLFYNFRLAIVIWGILGCFLALAMKEISLFKSDELVLETLNVGGVKHPASVFQPELQLEPDKKQTVVQS